MPNRSFKLVLPNGVSLQPEVNEPGAEVIAIHLDSNLDLGLAQTRPLISTNAFDYTVGVSTAPLSKDPLYTQELVNAFITTFDRYTPLELPLAWKILLFLNSAGEIVKPEVYRFSHELNNYILAQRIFKSFIGPDRTEALPPTPPTRKEYEQLKEWVLERDDFYCCCAEGKIPQLHTVADTIKALTVGVTDKFPPQLRCKILHYLLLWVFTHLNIKYTPETETATFTALKILFPEVVWQQESNTIPTAHVIEATIGSEVTQVVKKDTELLTSSQTHCFNKLKSLANLYLNNPNLPYVTIKPRLNPLIAGPTGSGKSHLVRKLAEELNLPYLRLTYGQWSPLGSRQTTPTLISLARHLTKHPKCILHIDELDKWGDNAGEWSRAISTDLWDVLESVLSLPNQEDLTDDEGIDVDLARERLKSATFIIGSGTWQQAFNKTASPLGFAQASSNDEDRLNAIHNSKMIPQELLGRFHTDICILNYPNKAETKTLLDNLGLTKLAASVNSPLTDIAWEKTGFRALESLTSDLLVKHQTLNQVVQNTVS